MNYIDKPKESISCLKSSNTNKYHGSSDFLNWGKIHKPVNKSVFDNNHIIKNETDILKEFQKLKGAIDINKTQYSKFKSSIDNSISNSWLNINSLEAKYLKNINKEELILIATVLIAVILIIRSWWTAAAWIRLMWRWISQIWINLIGRALRYEKTSSFLIAFIPWSRWSWLLNMAPNQKFAQIWYFWKELWWPIFTPLIQAINQYKK